MEINLQDWLDLNMELSQIEMTIMDLVAHERDTDLAVQSRDVILKKLLVFLHLFGARSDRLEEILEEEPEYIEFLKYIEEAENKDAVDESSPQRREHRAPDDRDGVRSWYGSASPIGRLRAEGEEDGVLRGGERRTDRKAD